MKGRMNMRNDEIETTTRKRGPYKKRRGPGRPRKSESRGNVAVMPAPKPDTAMMTVSMNMELWQLVLNAVIADASLSIGQTDEMMKRYNGKLMEAAQILINAQRKQTFKSFRTA